MKKYKYITGGLYLIFILSAITLLAVTGKYIEVGKEIEEEILEDYNYQEIQDIVISEELSFSPQYNAQEMKNINNDFCGWIFIEDSPINYPVVQGFDNEFYLNHSFEKEYSKFGCIFISPGNDVNDDNIILHGHNMGKTREEMFSSLLKYEDYDYRQKYEGWRPSERPHREEALEDEQVFQGRRRGAGQAVP